METEGEMGMVVLPGPYHKGGTTARMTLCRSQIKCAECSSDLLSTKPQRREARAQRPKAGLEGLGMQMQQALLRRWRKEL
jgi:hypothetical protein